MNFVDLHNVVLFFIEIWFVFSGLQYEIFILYLAQHSAKNSHEIWFGFPTCERGEGESGGVAGLGVGGVAIRRGGVRGLVSSNSTNFFFLNRRNENSQILSDFAKFSRIFRFCENFHDFSDFAKFCRNFLSKCFVECILPIGFYVTGHRIRFTSSFGQGYLQETKI